MAFNVSNPAVPYYQPVPPVVPKPDDTAAKLISQGTQTALSAFVSMAEARARNELAKQEMLQNAELKAREFDIQEKGQAQNFELHKMLYGTYQEGAATRKMAAETSLLRALRLNTDKAEEITQLNQMKDGFRDDAKAMGLNDPKLQLDPLKFAAAVSAIRDYWGDAPLKTGIKDQLSRWQNIADQQKITVNYGAVEDSTAPNGFRGGRPTPAVAWKVYRDLMNPSTSASTWNALRAAGHVKTETTEETPTDQRNFLQRLLPDFAGGKDAPAPVTKQREIIDNQLSSMFGSGADFTPRASKVPPASQKYTPQGNQFYNQDETQPESDQRGVAPTSLGEGDATDQGLPPDVSSAAPTKVDRIIAQAQAAIKAGAPRDRIAERLSGMEIDPGLLDQYA